MLISNVTCSNPPSRRRGFTMIELLVVVAIIAILTALITVASVAFLGTAKQSATRATIFKVQKEVEDRVSNLNEAMQKPRDERNDILVRAFDVQGILFATQKFSPKLEAALLRKAAMIEMFPQTPAELQQSRWMWAQFDINGDGELTGTEKSSWDAKWQTLYGSGTTSKLPTGTLLEQQTTASELLYIALTQGPALSATDTSLDDLLKSSEVADTDGDGVSEIVDAWGTPLAFYRWPTRLVNGGWTGAGPPPTWDNTAAIGAVAKSADWAAQDQHATNPNPNRAVRIALIPDAPQNDLAYDPDDREGYLGQFAGLPIRRYGTSMRVGSIHDPNTFHAPLIVSAGPDRELGLFAPSDTTNFGVLAAPDLTKQDAIFDNLTNHSVQAGGI